MDRSGAGSPPDWVVKKGRGHKPKNKGGRTLFSEGPTTFWDDFPPLVSNAETANLHHIEERHGPQRERDIYQPNPGDDPLRFGWQNNTQYAGGDHGPKIKAVPMQALRSENPKPSPGQRHSDRQKEQEAAQRKPDEGRFPPPSRTDNIDGDTRSLGERQRGGISRRHSGQHHLNERARASKRRSHNERAAPENKQQPREGRAVGGRGQKQDTRHDGNSRGAPTSPTPEDGGVPLGCDEFSQQPPSCHRAGGGTGADPRQFNQRGQKV